MSGSDLRQARRARGWTQQQTAQELGVSQGYVSLLECNQRPVSKKLLQKLRRVLELPPTALPVAEEPDRPLGPDPLVRYLAALGYPGYVYLRRKSKPVNPATLLLGALRQDDLEPRLAAALPWVVLRYPNLNWPWLLERAKVHEVQNRLGFTVTLARKVGERLDRSDVAQQLAVWEQQTDRARLVREDVYGRTSLTEAEKRWLRERRPEDARHWNLLTSLSPERLPYAA